MSINKLSAKFCDHAPTGTHFDGEGLYLLVKADKKRYWHMACYLHGKKKLLSFGRYPKISLEQARKARSHAQQLLAQGIDPVQYKREQKLKQIAASHEAAKKSGNTFEQIARRLYDSKANKTTEEYRNKMLRQLEIHLFPKIGHKHIEEVGSAELLDLFRAIAKKTNHGREMTYMAKKLCQWTSEIFDFAHVEDHNFYKNPCRIIIKYLPSHNTQNMSRVDLKELTKFLKDLNNYNGHQIIKSAIWLMLYTGVRTISVRRALKKDINFDEQIWYRQPEKADKTIHSLPLPHQAISKIKEAFSFTENNPDNLVFPCPYKFYRPMSENAICQALKRMGYGERLVGHGLRAMVDTGLHELGYSSHIIAKQLGHKEPDKVQQAYNKAEYFEKRCEMMQAWADYLDKLLQDN